MVGIKLDMRDLAWLLKFLKGVATRWLDFGIKLKLDYEDLKIVEHDNGNQAYACLRETMASWLQQSPCAEQLLKALNDVDEKKLCHDLRQDLIEGKHRAG